MYTTDALYMPWRLTVPYDDECVLCGQVKDCPYDRDVDACAQAERDAEIDYRHDLAVDRGEA